MPAVPLPFESLRILLVRSLAEDLGRGDVTTRALEIRGQASARVVAQARGTVAGLPFLEPLFALLDRRIRVELKTRDGRAVRPGQELARIRGPASALLAGERSALNLLMHCSGIATHTRRFVDAVRGTRAAILDTRKTLPGLRDLEKYSVLQGGGQNHRHGLDDQILIKPNHLLCARVGAAQATLMARGWPQRRCLVETEARSVHEALEAAEAGADIVLLDNFTPRDLAAAVRQVRARFLRRPLLEASGGITLANVKAFARTGVDRISIGALTHSAPAFPMALRFSA